MRHVNVTMYLALLGLISTRTLSSFSQATQPSQNPAPKKSEYSNGRYVSKKETEDWILSKFRAYVLVDRRHSNVSGKDVITKYSDYKFSFENGCFIVNYLVEEGYGGKSSYREQAKIHIKDISRIIYYGSLTNRLDIIGHYMESIETTNIKTGVSIADKSFTMLVWVKSDLDYDIGNRLSKAFWHLQEYY